MISKTQEDFWKCFHALPTDVQQQARGRFALWQRDPFNPALHFKPLLADIWSVRVNQQYRALGRRRANLVVWFWIGSHAEYDELIKRWR